MKKDELDHLFDRLGGEFDTAAPSANHKAKFLEKLQQTQTVQPKTTTKVRKLHWWKPLMAAASILIIAGLIFTNSTQQETKQLADISPEMSDAQAFFTRTIEKELFEIEKLNTPATAKLVDDAMMRMRNLEQEYKDLQDDLNESGEDKRVIYAMIDNFQNRIDLLQQVLEHMEAIKVLNTLQPETL